MDINKEINKNLNVDLSPKKMIIKKKKSSVGLIVVVIIALLGILGGMYFGKMQGKNEARQEFLAQVPESQTDTTLQNKDIATLGQDFATYKEVVDYYYPPLKEEDKIMSFEGSIVKIEGSLLSLEIRDPSDNLPHVDGSPIKKQTRIVTVNDQTKITLIDTYKVDKNGNTLRTSITLSALKAGDYIIVTSATDIRNAMEFVAKEIKIAK